MAEANLPNMECPVCYEVLQPPVGECENGHFLCNDCHEKLKVTSGDDAPKCPVCRGGFVFGPTASSGLVERIYWTMDVKCRYHNNGCNVVLPATLLKRHMLRCMFLTHFCPMRIQDRCLWEGSRTFIAKHYLDEHVPKQSLR